MTKNLDTSDRLAARRARERRHLVARSIAGIAVMVGALLIVGSGFLDLSERSQLVVALVVSVFYLASLVLEMVVAWREDEYQRSRLLARVMAGFIATMAAVVLVIILVLTNGFDADQVIFPAVFGQAAFAVVGLNQDRQAKRDA